jgi:hypothetical protein
MANIDSLSQEEQDSINAEFTANAINVRIENLEAGYARQVA